MMTAFGTPQAATVRFASLPLAERLKQHASAVGTQEQRAQKEAQKKSAEALRQKFNTQKVRLTEELAKPAFPNSAGGHFSHRDVLEVVSLRTRQQLHRHYEIGEVHIASAFNLSFRPERAQLKTALLNLKNMGLINWTDDRDRSNMDGMRVQALGDLALKEINVSE